MDDVVASFQEPGCWGYNVAVSASSPGCELLALVPLCPSAAVITDPGWDLYYIEVHCLQ